MPGFSGKAQHSIILFFPTKQHCGAKRGEKRMENAKVHKMELGYFLLALLSLLCSFLNLEFGFFLDHISTVVNSSCSEFSTMVENIV